MEPNCTAAQLISTESCGRVLRLRHIHHHQRRSVRQGPPVSVCGQLNVAPTTGRSSPAVASVLPLGRRVLQAKGWNIKMSACAPSSSPIALVCATARKPQLCIWHCFVLRMPAPDRDWPDKSLMMKGQKLLANIECCVVHRTYMTDDAVLPCTL